MQCPLVLDLINDDFQLLKLCTVERPHVGSLKVVKGFGITDTINTKGSALKTYKII